MEIIDNIIKILVLMKYSIRKILFKKRIIIAFLILLTVIGVMGYAGAQNTDRLFTGSELLGILIVTFFMPAICMIYGSSVIRDEIEDKSIFHVFTSPFDRIFAYLSYYFSLVICLSLIIAVITSLGFISYGCSIRITTALRSRPSFRKSSTVQVGRAATTW